MYCYSCMNEIKDGNYCYKCMKENVPESSSHQLKAGTVLHGKYFVGNPIGEGGFGITYIGKDTVLGKRVAIKEFFPFGSANRNNDVSNNVEPNSSSKEAFFEKGKQNFLVEARSLAHYDNEPGIVDVIDFFEENNTVYIIMEYLDGINLNEFLNKNGVFSADTLFGLMLPIMKSLEKIHADGVVHRDITPDNIMYLYDGTLKLMDFGSARFITNESSDVSVILKEGYAPEEQYHKNGKQGPWTDVYGMCATMYKCITGKIPEGGLDRIREDKLKKPSELGINISQPLEKVLMYGMAVFHENRCQNMTELMDMTKRALNSEQITINKKDTVSDEINKTKMADEVYRTQAVDEIYNNRSQDRYVSEEPIHQSHNGVMYEKSSNEKPKKKKTGLIIGIIVVVIAIVGAAVAFGVLGNNSNNKSTDDDNPSTVVETTVPETAPTLSETDKAITDAGLKVGADGKITDKNGKEVKVDKDGKVEVKNEKGETVKVDSSEVKKANQNKVKVDNYPTNSPSQKKDTSTSSKGNGSSSSKSNSSKSDGKKDTSSKSESSKQESSKSESSKTPQSSSSSSKADSSKNESSKPTPKPQHTHSWTNITEKVKVVDKEAYTYEEPVYEEQGRVICNDCGQDITDLGESGVRWHTGEHLENGGKGSYRVEDRQVQVGTKKVNVPEKSHYETKTIGRKCSGCGKVEYY